MIPHYSSCHFSSVPLPHPSRSPIFFSLCLLFYFFFYLLLLNLSHALLSLIFLSSLFCLHSALSQHTSFTFSSPKQHPFFLPFSLPVFFYVLSIHLSISPPLSRSLSPPLISLPMLWFVSPVSVRTVITAVSSLGENKVVLRSRHHKRQEKNKRKELQPKKRGGKEEKLKRRGVN